MRPVKYSQTRRILGVYFTTHKTFGEIQVEFELKMAYNSNQEVKHLEFHFCSRWVLDDVLETFDQIEFQIEIENEEMQSNINWKSGWITYSPAT